MEELVVLVDDQDNPIGTASKNTIHTRMTPLHRAFSLFLFDVNKKDVLLTKRALTKKTFPGVWTNAVCGHPAPGETTEDAIVRRLNNELGITNREIMGLQKVSPYQYRFADSNGIVENEICPIYIGLTDKQPHPNPLEVDEWKWMNWHQCIGDMQMFPDVYSPWFREEAIILQQKDLALQ